MQTLQDKDLVRSAQAGNKEAFGELVTAWQRRLYDFVLRSIENKEDAKDIVQKTLLKAWKSIGNFRSDKSTFSTWLFRIACCQVIDWKRTAERKHTETIYTKGGYVHEPVFENDAIRSLCLGEEQQKLVKVLDQLTDDYREIILLREREGFTYREIALVLSITEGAARTRIYNARQRLIEILFRTRRN